MHSKTHCRISMFGPSSNSRTAGIALLLLTFVAFYLTFAAQAARAQTFTVLHTFNLVDGQNPMGVTMDARGNLYGTTSNGHTAYKLTHSGPAWVITTLYRFSGESDIGSPNSRLTIGRDGTLYGTTQQSTECYSDCGTAFHLTPTSIAPRSLVAPWKETVGYVFDQDKGWYPLGDLLLDRSGNVFGTAAFGGNNGCGMVYELTPAGNSFAGTVIYSFQCGIDGENPVGGVVSDRIGNLYGVTLVGGSYYAGTIYKLSLSGSTWAKQILHDFAWNDGQTPVGGLIIDSLDNLYGTTTSAGTNNAGTIFEFTPGGEFKDLYDLPSIPNCIYPYQCGSQGALVMDGSGDLYGTTTAGGAYEYGNVFKLTHTGGAWTYASLHDFMGYDGAYPMSGLILDHNGNLYGAASQGGIGNDADGTVFEITP